MATIHCPNGHAIEVPATSSPKYGENYGIMTASAETDGATASAETAGAQVHYCEECSAASGHDEAFVRWPDGRVEMMKHK